MSRNSGQSSNPSEALYCKCGFELPLVTSWTDHNPGRRFRACPRYGVNLTFFCLFFFFFQLLVLFDGFCIVWFNRQVDIVVYSSGMIP